MPRRAGDRAMLEAVLEKILNKPLTDAERGERADAYRRLAAAMGVDSDTPRMWMARGSLPRHVRPRAKAFLDGRAEVAAFPDIIGSLDPDVAVLARRIQGVKDRTGGRGEVWQALLAGVQMAETWSKRGLPVSLGHLRPIPSS